VQFASRQRVRQPLSIVKQNTITHRDNELMRSRDVRTRHFNCWAPDVRIDPPKCIPTGRKQLQ
jgi:hypothetical protein